MEKIKRTRDPGQMHLPEFESRPDQQTTPLLQNANTIQLINLIHEPQEIFLGLPINEIPTLMNLCPATL
jgi:hypothetical protein